MRKIPTIFERDWQGDRSRVLPVLTPGCEWVELAVVDGSGVIATRKYDGTCCLVRDGKLYRRESVRDGKTRPDGFEFVEHEEGQDGKPGKDIGWVPVGEGPNDRWHREAFDARSPANGTYELVGPKIQKNPEGYAKHTLIAHVDAEVLALEAVDFASLHAYFAEHDIEGVVFHHEDGRMAKIKSRDFGLKRGTTPA